jgi:hypothetical protein
VDGRVLEMTQDTRMEHHSTVVMIPGSNTCLYYSQLIVGKELQLSPTSGRLKSPSIKRLKNELEHKWIVNNEKSFKNINPFQSSFKLVGKSKELGCFFRLFNWREPYD